MTLLTNETEEGATPFDNLTYKDASELIPDVAQPWLAANKSFYTGDHWQNADGWSGPLLPETHTLYQSVLLEIQRAFVSKNAIAEVVDRHGGGVIGREPGWKLTLKRSLEKDEEPTTEEQALIAEAEAVLTNWWDKRKAHSIVDEAVKTLLWAKRGALRLFVPPGQLDANGQVPQADLEESIMRLYLHHPDPEQSTVSTEADSMEEVGIYLYERDKQKFAELSYLDGEETVIRIIGAGSSDDAEEELPGSFRLPLDGHRTIYEMSRKKPLVTEQVRQQQKLLNLAMTMLQRNVIQGGFLERTFLNAQLPGEEVNDPDRPGEKKFIPAPFHTGPGATNFISGVVVEDSDGKQTLSTPSVVYRDPVPVDTFTETKEDAYRAILEEVDQIHVLMSDQATASGRSRQEARSEYVQSLKDTRTEVEQALRWLLETALAMAAKFAGQPGRFSELRANVEARLELGPIAADDQRVVRELVEAGIISRETGMGRVGIDDVDAERERIDMEQEAASTRQQQTLATAVLSARRGLDGGQQTNGLEQPDEGEQAPENLDR